MDLINSYDLTEPIFDNTKQTACLDNIFFLFNHTTHYNQELGKLLNDMFNIYKQPEIAVFKNQYR
mgnify:CR=1 FL=1